MNHPCFFLHQRLKPPNLRQLTKYFLSFDAIFRLYFRVFKSLELCFTDKVNSIGAILRGLAPKARSYFSSACCCLRRRPIDNDLELIFTQGKGIKLSRQCLGQSPRPKPYQVPYPTSNGRGLVLEERKWFRRERPSGAHTYCTYCV